MQQTGTAAFHCPSCGRELPVNLERYPRAGGTFPCPGCKNPITLPPIEEFMTRLHPEGPAALPGFRPGPTGSVPQSPPAMNRAERPPSSPGMPTPGASSPRSASGEERPASQTAPPPKPPQAYRIYLKVGGSQDMTRMEIWQAIRRGELGAATEVAHRGSDDWKPLAEYPELARLLEQQSRSVEARPLSAGVGVPAPLGRRFLAKVIDLLLLGIVFLPIQASIDRKLTRELGSIQEEAKQLGPPTAVPPSQGGGEAYQPSSPRRAPGSFPTSPEDANRYRADQQWQRAQQMQREQQARDQQKEAERQLARRERKVQQLGERVLTVLGQVLWQATVMSLLSQLLFVVLPLAVTGASVGKLAMGLRVRSQDGSDIGFGKALGRTAAEILSGCLLYIGYLMALFDDERRTLHDRMAGTRVEPK